MKSIDKNKPLVGIIMGSKSDLSVLRGAFDKLNDLGVAFEKKIISAHRTPQTAVEYASTAEERGIKVIIAAAGYAAHLAGFMAAHTVLPVIGIPIDGSSLNGLDSLLATVQMPGGVPVATVTIGKAGAVNAAILSVQILALLDSGLSDKLKNMKADMARKVAVASKEIEESE